MRLRAVIHHQQNGTRRDHQSDRAAPYQQAAARPVGVGGLVGVLGYPTLNVELPSPRKLLPPETISRK